uniref:Exostosin GT47 domain-containing protein n=1 Tax=Populus alba TaxID=43335 RepID=A0A4U5PNY3_POPAL|nr:hypothetical protein D5086_0000206100 [Populus alba]
MHQHGLEMLGKAGEQLNNSTSLQNNTSCPLLFMRWKKEPHTPSPAVISISEMNQFCSFKRPRWPSAVDQELLNAKSQIQKAPLCGRVIPCFMLLFIEYLHVQKALQASFRFTIFHLNEFLKLFRVMQHLNSAIKETTVRTPQNLLRDLGGKPASRDQSWLSLPGSMHGYLRPILLQHWGNKDPDIKVFGKLPKRPFSMKCVPVIISDNFVPPFFEVLTGNPLAVFVLEKDIPNLKNILPFNTGETNIVRCR